MKSHPFDIDIKCAPLSLLIANNKFKKKSHQFFVYQCFVFYSNETHFDSRFPKKTLNRNVCLNLPNCLQCFARRKKRNISFFNKAVH